MWTSDTEDAEDSGTQSESSVLWCATPATEPSQTEPSTPLTMCTCEPDLYPTRRYPTVAVSHFAMQHSSPSDRQSLSPTFSTLLATGAHGAGSPNPNSSFTVGSPVVFPRLWVQPGHRDTALKIQHLKIELCGARATVRLLEEQLELYRALLKSDCVPR
jgi:hypothetical protein